MRRVVVAAVALGLLAGCGQGSEQPGADASNQPAVDPVVVSAAKSVCVQQCARLEKQADACPGIDGVPPDLSTGAGLEPGYPATCVFDMAGGFETLDAVRTSMENAAPAGADDLPDLFAALDKASSAHDLFAARCSTIGLIPEYDKPADVRDCSEAVRESIRWLPIVARELKAVSG